MVDPLLKVGDRAFEASGQAAGDLAQEHARLGERVKEPHVGIGPDVRSAVVSGPGVRDCIEHPVGELGRGEDLVVGEVRDARQDVGIAPAKSEAHLGCAHPASSLTVIDG